MPITDRDELRKKLRSELKLFKNGTEGTPDDGKPLFTHFLLFRIVQAAMHRHGSSPENMNSFLPRNYGADTKYKAFVKIFDADFPLPDGVELEGGTIHFTKFVSIDKQDVATFRCNMKLWGTQDITVQKTEWQEIEKGTKKLLPVMKDGQPVMITKREKWAGPDNIKVKIPLGLIIDALIANDWDSIFSPPESFAVKPSFDNGWTRLVEQLTYNIHPAMGMIMHMDDRGPFPPRRHTSRHLVQPFRVFLEPQADGRSEVIVETVPHEEVTRVEADYAKRHNFLTRAVIGEIETITKYGQQREYDGKKADALKTARSGLVDELFSTVADASRKKRLRAKP